MTADEKNFFRPIPVDDPQGLIKVCVARSLDEIMAALAVRNVVYVGEQRCPYDEEFDGNDFAGATHLLARVRGEPAGTARLRWFADFYKLERIAVKPEHRGASVASALIMAAVDLARRKGYRKMLGHIQPHLLPFWARIGSRIRPDRKSFVFSDYEYIEIEVDLEPPANALNLNTDPLIFLRPEGLWDEPGVLDRSAARGASNKSNEASSG
jgi:predicted GNAT family N-acyltransferase